MRVALIAEEAAGLHAVRRVLQGGHELAMILSSDVRRRPGSPGIVDLAQSVGIPVVAPAAVRDAGFADRVRAERIDVLLNVHSLFVIHAAVLDAAAVGAFNLHPAPLPEYAGLNAVSWAVHEGASAFGSTLHWMVPRIDAGPIAYAKRFAIDEDVSAGRLMSRTVQEGLGLLDQLLAQLSRNAGDVPRITQDLSRRRYFGRDVPHDGCIDWTARSAGQITRFVRACDYEPFESPWGRARARIGGLDVEVTRAAVTGMHTRGVSGGVMLTADGKVLVAASDEWVEVRQVRLEGRVTAPRDLAKRISATTK